LPQGVTPTLGPDATGVGWVYEYTLESDRHTLQELRSIQDWYLRYELTSLEGVSEVASLGGFVKQYQVAVDPNRLLPIMPITEVIMAIERRPTSMSAAGPSRWARPSSWCAAAAISSRSRTWQHGGHGQPGGHADPGQGSGRGAHRPEMRRGWPNWNGEGETVGGIIVMRFGENALATIDRVKAKLEPEGRPARGGDHPHRL
jgi:copper/silver efflux system protein